MFTPRVARWFGLSACAVLVAAGCATQRSGGPSAVGLGRGTRSRHDDRHAQATAATTAILIV